jgi:hypothetical protein
VFFIDGSSGCDIVSGVYVYYVKCFCVFYNKISTFGTWDVYVFSKALFKLFFNIVIFQKRNMRIIKLDNIFLSGAITSSNFSFLPPSVHHHR